MSIYNRVPRSLLAAILFGTLVVAPVAVLAQGHDGNEGNGARASVKREDAKQEAHRLGTELSVQINDNGKVLVRGAKVTAVSGNSITVTTNFGSTAVAWTVTTDSSTKFTVVGDKNGTLGSIAVGDVVSFNGVINSSASTLTVAATQVKDWTKKTVTPPAVEARHTFEGTLSGSVSSSTLPASFTLKIGANNYTVMVPSGTAILNKNWATTNLGIFQNGDTVRVYGSAEASSTSLIDAVVVRDATR